MTTTFRAHFDGAVLIPEEQVSLPIDEPLTVEVVTDQPATPESARRAAWQEEMAFIRKRMAEPTPTTPRTWRREDLYE